MGLEQVVQASAAFSRIGAVKIIKVMGVHRIHVVSDSGRSTDLSMIRPGRGEHIARFTFVKIVALIGHLIQQLTFNRH